MGGTQPSHSFSSIREPLQQWDMKGCISGQSVGSLWRLSRKQLVAAVSDELRVLRGNQRLRSELWETLPLEGQRRKSQRWSERWSDRGPNGTVLFPSPALTPNAGSQRPKEKC